MKIPLPSTTRCEGPHPASNSPRAAISSGSKLRMMDGVLSVPTMSRYTNYLLFDAILIGFPDLLCDWKILLSRRLFFAFDKASSAMALLTMTK